MGIISKDKIQIDRWNNYHPTKYKLSKEFIENWESSPYVLEVVTQWWKMLHFFNEKCITSAHSCV